MGVCRCGQPEFSRGLCRGCYGRRWRKKNRDKMRGYNRGRDWSQTSLKGIDVLEVMSEAFNLEEREIVTYIRALREGVA